MRALVVDDDRLVSNLIAFILRDEGYEVTTASTGTAALAFLEQRPADVIILDVVMPKVDGLELCSLLRASNPDAIILILTGRRTLDDRVAGLDAGADDYLTKPFEPSELIARLKALARRYLRQQLASSDVNVRVGDVDLRVGDLQVAISTGTGVRRIGLTPTEAKLLRCLMLNANHVVAKETLLGSIWGESGSAADTQAIAVYIRRLRKKLEIEPGGRRFIELVWGNGYRFSSGGSGSSTAAD